MFSTMILKHLLFPSDSCIPMPSLLFASAQAAGGHSLPADLGKLRGGAAVFALWLWSSWGPKISRPETRKVKDHVFFYRSPRMMIHD